MSSSSPSPTDVPSTNEVLNGDEEISRTSGKEDSDSVTNNSEGKEVDSDERTLDISNSDREEL